MIKFSQVHEDPNIELRLLQKHINTNPKVLLIASGGSTGFYLINKKIKQIDMIDSNPEQIKLCKKKLDNIILNNIGEIIKLESCGLFENLFREVKLKPDNIHIIFSKNKLIEYFSEEAVKYSSESFSTHFSFVIENLKKTYPINSYWRNQLTCEKIILPIYWSNKDLIVSNANKFNFISGSIIEHLEKSQELYHLISLSNITDWMDADSIIKLLNLVGSKLELGGNVIIRKLISDHDLEKIITETKIFKIIEHNFKDATLMYKGIYILEKAK